MTTAAQELPFVDEHRHALDAPSDAVWEALLAEVRRRRFGGEAWARLLGCDPARGSDEFTGIPGEAVPGFRVFETVPGRRLVLRGRHRFAGYALTFVLESGQLRARTHAAFPGLLGRLYRAAVIGSGAHARITRRLLRRVARAAGPRLAAARGSRDA